jgi:uncharacterized protein YhfF
MNKIQQKFLDQYLSTLSKVERDSIPQFLAEHFCSDEYNANECARLIDNRIKRASSSLKACYDQENEPFPEVGRITVVLNWAQEPVCIIKLTDVTCCPFNKVTC